MASASRTISTGRRQPGDRRSCRSRPAAIAARTDRPRQRHHAGEADEDRRVAFSSNATACQNPSHSDGRSQLAIGADLKPVARSALHEFNYPDSATDPIQIVRRYERADDREVVGFCAAALALRPRRQRAAVDRASAGDHGRPAGRATSARFDPLRHDAGVRRFRPPLDARPDLVALLWILQADDRSVGIDRRVLPRRLRSGGARRRPRRSTAFRRRALALDLTARRYGAAAAPQTRPGVCYFFPRPSAGSGCKRLNLFLRWMVRRDALDLGVWSRVVAGASSSSRSTPT